MTGSRDLMFHRLAPIYDLVYDGKDYEGETKRLIGWATRFGRPNPTSWLDVACGTGRHLRFLQRRFDVVGVDASADMLRLARDRLPGVRLVRADMRSFDLGREFDVLSCLFSAIGHLPSEAALGRAFANFARHLRPGGVALIEPWIDPPNFRPGHLHLVTKELPDVRIARLSHAARRGPRSLIAYHYLIGRAGRGVEYCVERNLGLMVGKNRMLGLARAAGLRPRLLPRGLTPGRAVLVAVKPRERPLRTPHRPGETRNAVRIR